MITVEHLSKRYGSLTVLKDVNVHIGKGEVISIIGPSGTGKSTLLRCLNLLDVPSGGHIRINGTDILDPKTDLSKVRQKANMVFQSFNLFSHLTALENLTLAPMKLQGKTRAEAEEKAMETLRLVGMAERAQHYPDELSGGQKQRVAIARCLAMEPEIILFDEPTSALDPTMVSEVLSVIRRLSQEGITMAIVTHEMKLAREVSDKVLYMDEGIIYEMGTPEQIFDHPQKEKTRIFINRIRTWTYSITSRDYDLYAMNAEIEAFCNKQYLPKEALNTLLLLTEEILALYSPYLNTAQLELKIAYSEETGKIEIIGESTDIPDNPMECRLLPDDLSATIIQNMAEDIRYENGQTPSRLIMTIRKTDS